MKGEQEESDGRDPDEKPVYGSVHSANTQTCRTQEDALRSFTPALASQGTNGAAQIIEIKSK